VPPSDSPMERDRSLVSIPESTESRKTVEPATPLQYLPGVGPLRVELFHKIGVRRPIDLLFLFPRSYQDIAPFQGITELEPGIRATVVGQIVETDQRYSY
jgi:ATP-dependent DNA helicase RecG